MSKKKKFGQIYKSQLNQDRVKGSWLFYGVIVNLYGVILVDSILYSWWFIVVNRKVSCPYIRSGSFCTRVEEEEKVLLDVGFKDVS